MSAVICTNPRKASGTASALEGDGRYQISAVWAPFVTRDHKTIGATVAIAPADTCTPVTAVVPYVSSRSTISSDASPAGCTLPVVAVPVVTAAADVRTGSVR